MNKLKINSNSLLLAIKVVFTLFITYLILLKGDAGIIINNIGNFIVSGNVICGFAMLVTLFAIYPVITYNLTQNTNSLQRLCKFLFCFDGVLACINLLCGIFYYTKFLNMPMEDAFAKFIVLADGSGVVYILTSIIIILLIKNLIVKENKEQSENIEIDNIPFCFSGRIDRTPYLITKVSFYLFLIILIMIKQHFSKNIFDIYEVAFLIFKQIIFILSFYAASKRLRDIRWSQWFLVLWSVPVLGIGIGLPLLFMKSKFATDKVENQ